jgi:erythromycin esterase
VRDSAGAPVPGARLQAARMSPDEGEVFVTLADAEGRYALSLPGGLGYMLVVDAPPRPRAYRELAPEAQIADWNLEPPPPPRPADAEIKGFLADHAISLATLQPGSGTADLAPLKAMIGDARVVAIGEATHGSAEFFLLRHRLLELLAGELGFTVVAIEAGWADAFAADEYVFRGKGDPVKVLAGLRYWRCRPAWCRPALDAPL